jgi:AraC-like DNA-binding protein
MTEDEHYQLYIISKILSSLSSTYYLINDFYIYFRNTDIILSPTAVYTPERFFKHVWPGSGQDYNEWYASLLSTSFRNTLLSDTGEYLSFAHSLPFHISGFTQANLIIMVDRKKISVLFGSMDWLNNGYLYVIDAEGRIVFSNDYNSNHEEYLKDSFDSGHGYRIIGNAPEGPLALSYVTSNQQGWKYISLMPTEIYMKRVEYIKWVSWLIFMITLLVGLLLVVGMTYHSYSPVKKIMNVLGMNNMPNLEQDEFRFIQHTLQSTIEEKARLLSQMDEQKPIVRSNILLRILEGKFSSRSQMSLPLETVDIHFPYECFMVAVLEFDIPDGDIDIALIDIAVQEYLEKRQDKHFIFYLIEAGHERLALLLNVVKEYCVDDQLKKLQHYIIGELGISCNAGVGAWKSGLGTVNRSYAEALRALNYKLYRGISPVIWYNDIVQNDQSYYYPLETERQLIVCLKTGDLKESKKHLDYIFRENLEKRALLPAMYSFLFLDIMGTLIKVLNELNLNIGDVFGADFDFATDIQGYSSVRLYELVNILCGHIEQHKKSHNILLADKIHGYIKKNYHDPNLCLQLIADTFHLSTAYLSRFFKEQSGENLNAIIHSCRIEKAKELLRCGNTGIGEIARLTGFTNDVTFNRVFKKAEGITPGIYRQQNRK